MMYKSSFNVSLLTDQENELYKRLGIETSIGVSRQDVHGVQSARADRESVHHEKAQEQAASVVNQEPRCLQLPFGELTFIELYVLRYFVHCEYRLFFFSRIIPCRK